MKLTIALCTRNNCASLVPTLQSLRTLEVPLAAELVLIDNGSSDGTWEVMRSYTHPTLPVRRIREETAGLCRARNRAVAESTGDVIAFTDDDVRVPPDWIQSLLCPIVAGRAEGVVGGIRLAPHLQKPWMTPLMRAWFGSTELLDSAAPAYLIGANMAFLRSVTERVPAFDEDLDPGRLGAWGDTLFSWQLLEAGFRLAGAFDHEIEHHFDQDRLSRARLVQAARVQGVCRAYVSHHWRHERRARSARRLVRAALEEAKRMAPLVRHRTSEGVAMEELLLVEDLWFEWRWLQERRRPKNYARRGLVRVTHA